MDLDNESFMHLAVEEARKCTPLDRKKNPYVGAVVVLKDGRVTKGHHEELGPGEHAEYTALERKLRDEVVAGATLYTTLEPCTERNPPKNSLCRTYYREKNSSCVYRSS